MVSPPTFPPVQRKGKSVDVQLAAVRNTARRELLFTLLRGGRPTDRTDTESNGLSIPMRHVHLPKLADMGYIDPDWETRVATGPRFDEIEPLLRFLAEKHDPLSQR